MRSSMKAAALTAAAVPLFITACSSSSSSTASPSSPSSPSSVPASSGSPASSPPTAASTGDPLASLSADQIASKANADLKAASSYHFSGTIVMSGTTQTLKLTRGAGTCAGTITIGNQPISFVQIGTTEWVQVGGGSEYLKTTTSNSSYKQDMTFCDPGQVASVMNPPVGGLAKGTTTTVNGQRAQQLTLGSVITIDVTISATPEYVRFVDTVGSEHVQLDFSGINAPVSINPPPASEVLGV